MNTTNAFLQFMNGLHARKQYWQNRLLAVLCNRLLFIKAQAKAEHEMLIYFFN
jgi:hypothetical protein